MSYATETGTQTLSSDALYQRMLKLSWMRHYSRGNFTAYAQELRDYEAKHGRVPCIRVTDGKQIA